MSSTLLVQVFRYSFCSLPRGCWVSGFSFWGTSAGFLFHNQTKQTKQKGKTTSKEEFMQIIEARKAWARGPKTPNASTRHSVSRNMPRIEVQKGETPEQALERAHDMGIL
jgi:hypothetical protein